MSYCCVECEDQVLVKGQICAMCYADKGLFESLAQPIAPPSNRHEAILHAVSRVLLFHNILDGVIRADLVAAIIAVK